MTDAERDAFENLLLLCPNHHRMVDALDPDAYPVDRLLRMKELAHERCGGTRWASEEQYEEFASIVLEDVNAAPGIRVARPRPRLVVEKGDREALMVSNVGEVDAFDVRFEPFDQATADALAMISEQTPRISPGGSWRPALYGPTMGNGEPHAVVVRWSDDAGSQYDGQFPL
jgi:hypothetical protein